jgi:predicted Zn finger-like uncharacterized protein
MKFVCDRCLTKYSIADEKVRGRILKIRCKSCSNIITVKESAPSAPISVASGDSDRTVISSGPHVAAKPAAPPAPAPPRSPGRARPPTPPAPGAASADDIQWFLALEGVQKGPFTRKVLVDRLLAMPKDSDVHIWNDTLEGWRPPGDVPVIAREMQARQRAGTPSPPAPPPPRLRPVPPPPSQAPPGERRISGAYAAVGAAGQGAGAHAAPHGHPPIGASHSSVGLGLASVAPVVVPAPTMPPAGILDTPAPIRELVQAHKAQNGTEPHGAGLAGAPSAALANGESDALNALNLGGSWRQPAAPVGPTDARFSSASIAAATGARPGSRTVKLATGAVLLVGICVALIFVAFKKPSPPPVAASPKVDPPPVVAVKVPEPVVPSEPSKEVRALRAPDPNEVVAESENAPTVARVGGKKPVRPAPLRNPSVRGGATATTTAPGAFTPEQRGDASRFVDSSGRALQIRNPMAPMAKVTPNQGDITRVVNNNKGGIKVCYQRALLRDTSLTHGKIDVNVTIGISGRVKSVGVDGPAPFRALEPCIKDVLSRWVFPASSEEYGTAFSYVFQGAE